MVTHNQRHDAHCPYNASVLWERKWYQQKIKTDKRKEVTRYYWPSASAISEDTHIPKRLNVPARVPLPR